MMHGMARAAHHERHQEVQHVTNMWTCRLRARLRVLRTRMASIQVMCSKEASTMQEYTAFIEEHLQGLGSSTAQLQSQLEKVGQVCMTNRASYCRWLRDRLASLMKLAVEHSQG